MKKNIPLILLILYLILFVICAINPFDRAVRRAENIPVMITVALLVFTYRKFQFSTTAYIVMSLWIYMHTIGGHYTFERVPFDWFNNFFGFERNMYDRIAHYIIGFYAYPLIEYLDRKQLVNKSWILYGFGIFAIFTTSWMAENHFETNTVVLYGIILLLAAASYYHLSNTLRASEGEQSAFAKALDKDRKGKTSLGLYIVGTGISFWYPLLGLIIFGVVAIMWLIPDKRMEKALEMIQDVVE